jgi:hypothetical protein
LALSAVQAQFVSVPPPKQKGPYLGVLWGAVPEIVYAQVPDLPRSQGVAVTHVFPDSPASRAGLERNDIVLQYGTEKIRDAEHFARLISGDKVDKKVKLVFMRGGKQKTVETTLALGPVIVYANKDGVDNDGPRGLAKPTAPAKVSVTAIPLANNNMRLTIEYYDTGRLKKAVCSGSPKEIDSEIEKLPEGVQRLTRNALKRIRDLEVQKNTPPPPSSRQP